MRKNRGSNLEKEIVADLKQIDPECRITRGSGNHTEIADIYSNLFYIECKEKLTKENIIMDYKKEYLKLANKIPINSLKEMFIVIKNKMGEKFVVIKWESFFRILRRAYNG